MTQHTAFKCSQEFLLRSKPQNKTRKQSPDLNSFQFQQTPVSTQHTVPSRGQGVFPEQGTLTAEARLGLLLLQDPAFWSLLRTPSVHTFFPGVCVLGRPSEHSKQQTPVKAGGKAAAHRDPSQGWEAVGGDPPHNSPNTRGSLGKIQP